MKFLQASSNLRRTIFLITACFILVTLGIGGVAAVSWHYARLGQRQTETLTGRYLPSLVTLARLQDATLKLNSIILQLTLGKDEAAQNAQKAAFQAQSDKIALHVAELKTVDTGTAGQTHLAGFASAVEAYRTAAATLQEQLKAGDFEKAMATLDKEVATCQQQVETQLRALSEHFFDVSQGAGKATQALIVKSSRISTLTSGGLVLGTVLFMGIALAGARSVLRRMHVTSKALEDASDIVKKNALVLTSSSQSLAEGASEQAASLEETGASLEEMSSMTKRNAESARTAKELSNQTRAAADTGAADMEEMKQAMDAIKASSDGISKIIKTIDEIAFQTNILALNAAVEAARAGEAGMGFAVVAEEVRNLAQRSAQSAKETAGKIEEAIQKSEHGVLISGKVARSLGEIVVKARQVDTLVAEIASASQEQNQGIGQVNTAISQMDKVTQANAANAEETAAAAEQLNSQAVHLNEAVQDLHLLVGNETAQAGAPVAPPAARHDVHRVPSRQIPHPAVKSNGSRAVPASAPQLVTNGASRADEFFKNT